MQTLWDDGERVLSRSERPGEAQSALIVRPAGEKPLPESLDRLAHEYSLRDELDDSWAARPLQLLRQNNQTLLILTDPGGEPLASLLGAPMAIGAFLHLATGMAAALGKLHQQGLVHKDLKPAHILVNCADGHTRLTGFGLASRLLRERLPPQTIAGTLAYMAPEQTGRMNRSIDSRSDLYALGITFYQMLTATLPFDASDPMEWIHCHIAKKPEAPGKRVPAIPEVLCGIVMKLLAKTAEERYQTAAGVESDLRRCLTQWQEQRHISDFALDQHGTSDRLLIPEKLYGREREVARLIDTFNRIVASSTPQLLLVSGYSGIGKSSVVNELHKALVPPRGLFACGKFDQYKRDIPYATLVQAFQGLVHTLLGKSDTELAHWRGALKQALEPNASLITDLIPELELIIGKPPALPDLEPQQAKHRFQQVLRRFIGVFAQAEHPLALFLDDLQWLDAATLDLLKDLLTQSDLRHLMLIGAYRDNEVDALHPLTDKLQAIRKAGGSIDEITLAPLSRADIEQLIADSLHCQTARIEPLAQLVQEKTAGNPFFVIQFLQALADEGLLTFDHAARQWSWNADRIHAKGYTENVVDLMVHKLTRLPSDTQQALQYLACLGNVADINTLARVLDIPPLQVDRLFREAIRQELVERRDNACAFAHDRIHEATYSLIPEASRARMHLRIGRLLAAQKRWQTRDDEIFEIVGQLNRCISLITRQDERERLAHYNLLAGQRARKSTAFASALTYLSIGAQLLDEDCWTRRHELIFALESNRAACEFLTGQLQVAAERLCVLANHAETATEQSQIACLQVNLYLVLDQREHAVAACLRFLAKVGIEWSPHPSEEQVQSEYQQLKTLLRDRPIADLIDLPPMQATVALATLEALTTLIAAALHTDANLACRTICKAITLSLEYGNGDASCVAYANFPRVAGRRFGDYVAGQRFGQLGCELVEKRGLEKYVPRTFLCFSLFVERWIQPVGTCRATLSRVFEVASRIGDIPFASFACNSLYSNLLFTGEPLAGLQSEAEHGLAFSRKVQFGMVTAFIENQLALIRTLRGSTPRFGVLEDPQFSERNIESRLPKSSRVYACWYWIRKLQARYLAGDYESARHAAAQAESLLWTTHTFIEEAEFYFYSALAHAACCDGTAAGEQAQALAAMVASHRQLEIWTGQCADNFASRLALVGAEIARVEDRPVEAEHLYEQAIEQAQHNAQLHIEAMANELASRFYEARGFTRIARAYLQDARYSYLRWGADAKVRQLEADFAHLRPEERVLSPTTTIATPVECLDLATVLKVSQAASGDIVLEKLIEMVMATAVEQAGAERGLLILADGSEPRIAAEACTGEHATRWRDVVIGTQSLSTELLPTSIVYQVLRTREILVFDNAASESPFAADPYVRQQGVRSILCLPLMNQAHLTGALYLENRLNAGVFNPARIAVLKLVTQQTAISLENARLYRDIAAREAKIRRLVDSNIIGIIVGTTDGDIIEANDAFLQMVGYAREDLVSGQIRWMDLTPPEFLADSMRSMQEALNSGQANLAEKEYFRKDGSRVPVLVGLAMFEPSRKQGVAFVLDLSERKKAEQQVRDGERRYREVQTELAHANRVATMGQLAASIAHEVSQPIAATMMNAQAAVRWLSIEPPETDEVRQALASLIKDANRAADVLGRIRGHIHKAPSHKEPLDITAAIREIVEFTRAQATKSAVSVHTQLTEGLPLVKGDRVELQQVLLNLIINAFEAMGTLNDEQRHLHIRSALDDNDCVLVSVSDSGPGFEGELAEKVFKSFYTTKATGLGMGLSICRSIIEAHGGRLWACANHPRGAIVQFSLPAC
ncbi:AAA family ATPase [Pseudomonas sp. C1C7]|uniref:AAA family ATPase n=1 Tax=Pseudomonas sp. C1C7 TaxID=2735272 RepID=UPI00158648D4|nr:AAA family ATPase [Pseudomonas sp. C1C7]NUT78734.1 AAA family ATPase [Pseudomonas sp. C1C7]